MAKYDKWRDYLRKQSAINVVVSFADLDSLTPMPNSARKHEWWWANEDLDSTTHVQCKAWQMAGYEAHPDLGRKTVTFVRMRNVA